MNLNEQGKIAKVISFIHSLSKINGSVVWVGFKARGVVPTGSIIGP